MVDTSTGAEFVHPKPCAPKSNSHAKFTPAPVSRSGSPPKAPKQPPRALLEPQTPQEVKVLEQDAEVIVKAMINAAKADGQIDKTEIEKIVGKLEKDGLTREEKEFFTSEANKPMDINTVVSSAGREPEMAAQIYAASLLAIEVDTRAEQQYMEQLGKGLGLHPQVTAHIERTLGV